MDEEETNIILKSFQPDFRVACFTENSESLLMWSHYANCHEGFCIEYGFKDSNERKKLLPVLYSESRHKIPLQRLLENRVAQYLSITSKSDEWKYEKEWRIIDLYQEKNDLFVECRHVIKSIILGVRCPETEQNAILKWAKDENIIVYKMKLSYKEYKLIKEKIN